MKAIILAGGEGRRLLPYTTLVPKPLMPIGGKKAILEIILEQLSQNGFLNITIAVNHLAHLIEAYFGDGRKFGVSIDYIFESEPLGTMGPLRNAKDLPNNFLVMNGDVLTDLSFSSFLDQHEKSGHGFTISSYKRIQPVDYGVLEVGPQGLLRGFKEKPNYEIEVSMGIYGMNVGVLDTIPQTGAFGFDDLVLKLLEQNQEVGVIEHKGSWLDIGRPEDYDFANMNY
jgi:NDP-sugar pyrophosphorylase family protein